MEFDEIMVGATKVGDFSSLEVVIVLGAGDLEAVSVPEVVESLLSGFVSVSEDGCEVLVSGIEAVASLLLTVV